MSDRQRALLRELSGELGGLLRGHLSRSPTERAASAARWAALKERADVPAGDDFRDDLCGILSDVADRLEDLHDEILPDEPRPVRHGGVRHQNTRPDVT